MSICFKSFSLSVTTTHSLESATDLVDCTRGDEESIVRLFGHPCGHGCRRLLDGRAQPRALRPFLSQAPRKLEDAKVGRCREQSI